MENPKIRFLKNKHSWVRSTFEEIAKRRTKSSDNPDLPRIEYQDILSGEGRLNKELSKNIDCRKGIVFETNDILYGKLRPYLKNWLHPNFNGIALGDFWVLQARNCDSKFLFSLIQSPKFQRVANDTSGTKMPRSDWKTVSQTEFSIPASNDEQSAIGSLFRTLDDLLAGYKDNLANYQSLKATMLSKMFPKAGQSFPEIRLNGFEGEWEIKKFKSISTKRGKSNNKGYNYPAYSVSNQSGLILQSEQFEGSRLENLEKTSYKIVESNEFAYNPARINVGSIAFNDLDETVIVSSLYVIFSLDKSINNNYALLFIKSPEFNKEVRRNTEGSVREYLFYENFANIRIPIPPTLEEQCAIGSYFSNLDNLINSCQEKITQLETLKKKLLQDMFI